MTMTTEHKHNSMTELALYFLRLGFLGFGGPVALVGQMERELVNDKKWLTRAFPGKAESGIPIAART